MLNSSSERPGRLFDRLVESCAPEWNDYIRHPFVLAMADGSLPEAAFRHYLRQDYLFLVQFARAYALTVYKARTVEEMRKGQRAIAGILDLELGLHLSYCSEWGLSSEEVEATQEDLPTIAYSRFALDAGMSGDILDLHVALSPCVIGYWVIARMLAEMPGALDPGNRYARWISEYASAPYGDLAKAAIATLDDVAGDEVGPLKLERLEKLFRQACRLEVAFWQMGLDKV